MQSGYCYDAVFSKELRDHLTTMRTSTVAVEYNVFADLWGRARRRTVKGVGGMRVDRFGLDSGIMLVPRDGNAAGLTTDCDGWLANNK